MSLRAQRIDEAQPARNHDAALDAVFSVVNQIWDTASVSPLLMREARSCIRTYPEHAGVIRLALERYQNETARPAPVAAYDEYKPHALWSAREIAAWQHDYPEYQWDVWCVVCGVA